MAHRDDLTAEERAKRNEVIGRMYFVENKTRQQIAECFGIKISTVTMITKPQRERYWGKPE